jgi:hypothetical protein
LPHQYFGIGYCCPTIADSLWDEGFQQGGYDQYLSYWSESKHFFWNKALYVVPLQKSYEYYRQQVFDHL